MAASPAGATLPLPGRLTVRPVVGVMVRAPSCEGKSRLIRQLRTTDGAGLRTALLRDTLAAVASIDAQKAVLYTPRDGEAEIHRMTPFDAVFLAQRGATLGERMRNAAGDLLARGFGRVVLVGADLPTLPAAYLEDALERLARPQESLVLGPAEDGGYYLIGLTHVHDELFDGIPWGPADVLRRTQEAAAALQLPVELLPIWYDVDLPSDLQRVRHQTAEGHPVPNHTRAWLEATAPAVRASSESESP
jgi:rSAM/selenodomain-associated transferase 1